MDDSGSAPIVAAYDADFRASMWVEAAELGSAAALLAAAERLDPVAADLFACLRLAVSPGELVPDRFRRDIESDGEDFWRAGLLLPRVRPSPGATIDPRYYSGMCALNPALGTAPVWTHLQSSEPRTGHPPPTHVQADAIVVAAGLEATPLRLTQAGVVRRDDLRRFLAHMGTDDPRWELALAWAREAGLVRAAGPVLCGYPESKPRPIPDPLTLFTDAGEAAAGALLLRVAGPGWIALDTLQDELRERCPEVLAARTRPRTRWARREGGWLVAAAALLHRLGFLDAVLTAEGVAWFRRPQAAPAREGGFLLTPDREILVDPRELPGTVYGRLCRVAPFTSGDMVHRHRLTRDGVAADLAHGYDDLAAWLARWSRTGVPGNVASNIREWQRSAVRIRLFSGVSILEDPQRTEDRFTILEGPAPPDARTVSYRGTPRARFEIVEGIVRVPYGEDALTVRVLADRIGMPVEPGPLGWRWEIAPEPDSEPEALLATLRGFHDGPLPGELEAAVLGAGGDLVAATQLCTLLRLPTVAADALCRDRVAGPLLTRRLDAHTCIVLDADLPKVRQRLEWLGFQLAAVEAPDQLDEPDTAPSGQAAPSSSARGG